MNLKTKTTLLTTLVAVSASILIVLSIRGVFIDAFRGELEKRAVSVAGNLSDRVANNILLRDHVQTLKAFDEVLKKESDIEYIFVTNEDGKLFSHTFSNGYPPGLLSWNPLNKRHEHIQLLDTEKGYIRDIGVKVFRGTGSELHLGIREDSLISTLTRMRYITYPLITGIILLSIIASLVVSRLVTGPLNKFVEFTKVLGRGEYGRKVDVHSEDEVGYLARNFNRLSMELKIAQKKMEEAFTYTHLLEAEKLSSIGQISAGLAHELKNPMTTLKMLFQAYKEEPDMTREDAEIISTEIDKIDTILTNFMGFVKHKDFKLTDINLNELIDRVLSLATYDIEHSNITVYKDMMEALPSVKADRSLFEHVFLNLIINAIQAMPDGGEIRISGKSDDNFVEVMIWDKGKGIPMDIRAKIFEPFFTTKDQGTGLGLSIAYNIVNSHDGKLFFNSNESGGTVFTVRLPKGKENG